MNKWCDRARSKYVQSLFCQELQYNEAINIEMVEKHVCFKKKENRDPLEVETCGIVLDGNGR